MSICPFQCYYRFLLSLLNTFTFTSVVISVVREDLRYGQVIPSYIIFIYCFRNVDIVLIIYVFISHNFYLIYYFSDISIVFLSSIYLYMIYLVKTMPVCKVQLVNISSLIIIILACKVTTYNNHASQQSHHL